MNRKLLKLLSVPFTLAVLLVFTVEVALAQADSGQTADAKTNAPVQMGNELWVQVNACIQGAIKTNFKPSPVLPLPTPTCVYIQPQGMIADIAAGFAILKAKDSHTYHFLTIPTKAITGIEDPQVTFFLTPAAVNTSYSPNYWVPAWLWLNNTVALIYKAQKKPKVLKPEQMGLAINSPQVRSQNQLHIHMACIDKAVQTALAGAKTPISTCTTAPCTWSEPIPIPIPKKSTFSYRAVVLRNLSLNPFLVMRSVPHFDATKATLIVTGKPGTGQYYLLEDYAHGSDKGFGERLLDEDCAPQ
ncbi:MAG: CDP-diacylglycerol diphosphatase [Candidatus Binataceae bacterium]